MSTKKKDVQLESCELSFIWGKMNTAAQKAASEMYDLKFMLYTRLWSFKFKGSSMLGTVKSY